MDKKYSAFDSKWDEMVKEQKEKQGFIAGGVRVYGQTKRDYNVFITTLTPLIGSDPFWNAYFSIAK